MSDIPTDIKILHESDFKDRVNQAFELELIVDGEDNVTHGLELVECECCTPQEFEGKSRDPFSLIFKANQDLPIEQNTYTLKNKELGEVAVFLVPIGPDKDGNSQFQANFN